MKKRLRTGSPFDPNQPIMTGRFGGPKRGNVVAEGVPLAKLIKRDLELQPEIVVLSEPDSLGAERFRRLKTTLANLPGGERQMLVVSSAAPSDGKSTVSLNLALAYAEQTDQKTLLVDADLRRPTLGSLIRPSPQIGLSHLIAGQASEDHAILSLKQTPLQVLTAGERVENPLELITSQAMSDLMSSLREQYRHIILDTPPLVPFTDADAIATYTDGMILVVRAKRTPVSVYRQSLESVTSTQVLGVVLNDVARNSFADWGKHHGDDYGKYYDAYYRKDRGK